MKKIFVVLICTIVLSSALPVCAAVAEEAYKRLPGISFKDEAGFALKGIAADYARMDYALFQKMHDEYMLYREGIIDAASYIVGNTRFENRVGGSTLVFDSRHRSPIAGEIGIGTPISEVLGQFGEPDFTRRQDELIGYKTRTFYIAFTGKETVEKIYLSRRYSSEKQDNILPEFLASDNPGEFPFNKWNMSATHLWRSSMTYYSPGGLSIWDNYEDSYPVIIYSDYTGLIPEEENARAEIFMRDTDYPEHKIYAAIDEENAIQSKLADGLEPEYYSPDRSIAILPFTDGTYERSGFLIRYLDGSSPSKFWTFGHYPSKPIWLNERYFCVSAMPGFGIYDLLDSGDAMFYIEDDSYGELSVVNPVQQGKTLTIRGESITIHADDKQTPMLLKEKEQLLLQFQFSDDGKLIVKYSVVSR